MSPAWAVPNARHVPDEGSPRARFILIGEAPGKNENLQGRPFVGWSGHRMEDWWRPLGLSRQSFYITNVVDHQPRANKIGLVPRGELVAYTASLHARIAALDDPWLLVPTGNTALRALIGGKGTITQLRGSILSYTDPRGRTLKVIPTIHPAALGRTPMWEGRCRADWARIAEEAQTREVVLPQREHMVRPTLSDLTDLVVECQRAAALGVDIETPRALSIVDTGYTKKGSKKRPKRLLGERRITCLAVATDPAHSMTIPTTLAYWHDQDVLDEVWAIVATIAALPVPKATHYGLFDWWWLAQHGVKPARWEWDTNAMHHCLDPAEDHSLAYCASRDTRQPYWKNMKDAKDDDEAGEPVDLETFWHYNGIDAAVTLELANTYAIKLAQQQRLGYYGSHYRDLFRPLLGMALGGMRLDDRVRRRRSAELKARLIEAQDALTTIAGEPLYAKKSLSNKRLQRFLYETLKLPKLYAKRGEVDEEGRAKRTVTANEVAVRRLMLKHPHSAPLQAAAPRILEHRRVEKLAESYQDKLIDPDGRVYYSFSWAPETGRYSSGKAPHGRGRNIQNVDRETRDCYLADEGWLLTEVDLSQAEDRIVKAYIAAAMPATRRRDEILWRARAQPWENDEHKRAALALFPRVTLDTVTRDQRDLAKRTRHGANYDEGEVTLSDVMLKDGLVYAPDECRRMLDAIHAADPEIRDIYQKGVRATLMRTRKLANPWGWSIAFPYERLDDALYRRGYAWRPQSTVPQIINQWGILPLASLVKERAIRAHLHLQGHDSLVASVHPADVWKTLRVLKSSLEQPLTYEGVEVTIPVEFKLGKRWGCGTCAGCAASPKTRCTEVVEFKRFPSREECLAAIDRLVN